MDVHVSLGERGDLVAAIYRQLRAAVLDGRLHQGERLPPTRELAARLKVARNTVAVAYERLTAEGFLTSRVGAGTFVTSTPVDQLSRAAPAGTGVAPRQRWRSVPDLTRPAPVRPDARYDFSVGVPDARLFPLETWRRLIGQVLRPATIRTGYGDPAGHADLRAAIARSVGLSRSVRAGAEDVLITQGAQQALDLIGRVVIEPGDRVAVEEPGYPPARLLFRSLGARVVGVPVDAEGLDVSVIPDDVRLVYTTPSHQFPLGTPMSLNRRAALLAWAEGRDAVIVEDDYDSEFRFSDRPLEPLQSLDRSGRVIYVGSFSKTLLPMLRLGFLVAPASLRPALRWAKRLTDWHGDLATQAALARFIDEGLLARHIRKATREYAARHERITTTLRADFADWLDVVPSTAGLHVCTRLARPANVDLGETVDLSEVVSRARESGVAVESLADYCDGPGQPGLVLGYGAIAEADIAAGLRRLRNLMSNSGVQTSGC
ncbi:MAG TPA: PLP-dependent aminotransferase family protein [Pseudonocardiaceae bacterium]|nr:PLP-dependent aminotransferase family protein [Pseudonocardiaceae bacterium]